VQGVLAALDRPFPFEVFNLGESDTIELRDLIRLMEQYLGKQARIETLPPQPGDMPITFADITKARAQLGYRPGTPVKEGLKRFITWFRERQRGKA
jgi:UDP-glucuronate 4-epimerase